MNSEVFNEKHILFDNTATTQDEAFKVLANFAYENGFVADVNKYYQGLKTREVEATTGFKDHIAIPHCKNVTNLKPGLFLIKFANEIPWNALDGKAVKVAFGLTIPEQGAEEHLKLLSLIARKLIDDDFRKTVLTSDDVKELVEVIDEIKF